jgi:anti-sigma regulatory factor (Ser/Thr protein kinase)
MVYLELLIENRLEEIAKVADLVERFGTDNAVPRSAINDMNVSLDEVLNNIISYAYTDEVARGIKVRLTIANGELIANVDDDGMPFDPLIAPPPQLGGSIKQRPVGGLGIHFVKKLMDQVAYVRRDNRNCLELKKSLKSTSG